MSLRLLFIEDNPLDVNIFQKMLDQSGLQVSDFRTTASCASGITLIENYQPDLIFLDLTLEDTRGLDTYHRIRAASPNLPVIILTGNDDQQTALDALRFGAQDYLIKSEMTADLIRRATLYSMERKRMENELARSKDSYRLLLETINEGVMFVDNDNLIRFANKKFIDVTGYSEKEIIGKDFGTLLSTTDSCNGKNIVTELLSNDEPREIHLINRRGEEVWFSVKGSPLLRDDGTVSGALLTQTEITERKKTEAKFLSAQKELNTYIYRSSHDLKGPLSSILGLINVMEQEESITRNSPCVKMIRQSATKLERMINEMLNVVRIRKEKIFPEVIDFYGQVNEIVVGLRAGNEGFYDVRRNIQIDSKKPLKTDKKLLTLILHNLMDNAIKYRSKGNDAYMTVRVFDDMHGVKIEVEDNGTGFSQTARENIFSMFNRGNYTNDGSGLGLYMVKNAIDRLGGYIELKNNESPTTCFSLFLPDLSASGALLAVEG